MEYSPSLYIARAGDLCHRCHRGDVTFLKSMEKWSTLDWFKCERCGHIFTRPRSSHGDETDPRRRVGGSQTA